MSIYVGTSEIKGIYVGTNPVKEVYVGTTKVWPAEKQYSITPATSTTVYKNIAVSGQSVKKVVFSFHIDYYSQGILNIGISSNGNTNSAYFYRQDFRYHNYWQTYRKLNGGSESVCKSSDIETGITDVVFTINSDGNCSVYYGYNNKNYRTQSWTATGDELTTIQTIMNLSDINAFVTQNDRPFLTPNIVNIKVTYG